MLWASHNANGDSWIGWVIARQTFTIATTGCHSDSISPLSIPRAANSKRAPPVFYFCAAPTGIGSPRIFANLCK